MGSSIDITLVIAQLSCWVVCHRLSDVHVTPARPPIPTDILWKSPIHGSTVAVTASFPLLLSSGTLFPKLSFLFLMIFHLLRGRSITTLGGHRGLPCFLICIFYFFFPFINFRFLKIVLIFFFMWREPD